MAAFIIYAIRWAVTLTLLYSLFRILLRRETFHRLNRTVLLAILLVSPLLCGESVAAAYTAAYRRTDGYGYDAYQN